MFKKPYELDYNCLKTFTNYIFRHILWALYSTVYTFTSASRDRKQKYASTRQRAWNKTLWIL